MPVAFCLSSGGRCFSSFFEQETVGLSLTRRFQRLFQYCRVRDDLWIVSSPEQLPAPIRVWSRSQFRMDAPIDYCVNKCMCTPMIFRCECHLVAMSRQTRLKIVKIPGNQCAGRILSKWIKFDTINCHIPRSSPPSPTISLCGHLPVNFFATVCLFSICISHFACSFIKCEIINNDFIYRFISWHERQKKLNDNRNMWKILVVFSYWFSLRFWPMSRAKAFHECIELSNSIFCDECVAMGWWHRCERMAMRKGNENLRTREASGIKIQTTDDHIHSHRYLLISSFITLRQRNKYIERKRERMVVRTSEAETAKF